MQKFNVDDFVDENGREGPSIGQIVKVSKDGKTADVQFPDMEFPIRRQTRDLVVVRNNPMKLMKVPSSIPKTPRSSGNSILVFPTDDSFPIGDLYHARLALTYVLSPTHVDVRDIVIQTVQDAYPEYDWASWWNKQILGKPNLATWEEYVNGVRKTSEGVRQLVANPFVKRDEMKYRQNPRPSSKSYQVGEYDPSEAQFHAVVQGVYESLVKQYIGLKSSTPFKDDYGVRLDVKFLVPQEVIQELLGNAFAIATKQGQKLGTLKKGTQKATAKGKAKSKARAKDIAHLEENIQDYETTLGMARKGEAHRIVKQGKRFFIQPHEDAFSEKGYKTEASAKGVLTRYLNKLEDPSNLPTLENPRPKQSESKPSSKDAQWLLRAERKSKYRKPQSSKGSIANYARKLSWAEGTGKVQRWQEEGLTREQIAEKVDKVKLGSYKGTGIDTEMLKQPIVANVIIQYMYLPEMMSRGQPYLIYRRAPIAAFYTIELFGLKYKFQAVGPGGKTIVLDRKKWRSPEWAGIDGFNLKEDIDYTKEGAGGSYRKALPYATCAYYPGSRFSTYNGFQPRVVGKAIENVTTAYQSWYLKNQDKLKKSDPVLEYPTDCLEPVYEYENCRGNSNIVIDPILHFGVFLRALASLLQFKEYLEINNNGSWLDLSQVIKWIEDRKLMDSIKTALLSENINIDPDVLTTTQRDSKEIILGSRGRTAENEDIILQQVEDEVRLVWKDLTNYVKTLNLQKMPWTSDAKDAEISAIEKKIQAEIENFKYKWKLGIDNIPVLIRSNYKEFIKEYKKKAETAGITDVPKFTPKALKESIQKRTLTKKGKK